MTRNLRYLNAEAVVENLQPSSPVYCIRPAVLRDRAEIFCKNFPGRVLYATKCNPHPIVLNTLFHSGIVNFDAASLTEIEAVRRVGRSAIAYFMSPIKSRAEIRAAYYTYGVRHFAIDHADELAKIKQELGNAAELAILVRFSTPGGVALFELSEKFGAKPEEASDLLQDASHAGFKVGLAFHVGSQCQYPEAFKVALRLADSIAKRAGVELHYLDVGGGFPVRYLNDNPPSLAMYFQAIRIGIEETGLSKQCIVMCEPGRALVAAACSVITQVLLRKDNSIYINDGVYHSFAETVSGGLKPPVRLVRGSEEIAQDERIEFTVFGPTCDNTDRLPYKLPIRADVREGDWLEFGQMGAYSNAMASHFNGFFPDTFVTIDSPPFLVEDVEGVSKLRVNPS